MRQNDATNTTSTDTSKPWSVFSPQTAKSRDQLDVPVTTTSFTVYSSPVTAITQLSLQGPTKPEETGAITTTTTSSTSQIVAPSPIVQPSDTSLLVPVTNTATDGTSIITATAHVEISGTSIIGPGPDTTSQTRAPKMPHTEIGRTDLDQPSKPTDGPSTHGQDDNSGSETTAESHTQAGVIIPGATGSAQPGNDQTNQNSGSSGESTGAPTSPSFVIGNTPLVAGDSPITVDGTTYSLASTGSAVVVNGNTVAFTTNTQGQAVPVETNAGGSDTGSSDSATSNMLGGLSTASASATAGGESSQETGSTGEEQSTGGTTSTTSSIRTSTRSATATDSSSPALQSDNAGASSLQTWSFNVVVGTVGFLAMAV